MAAVASTGGSGGGLDRNGNPVKGREVCVAVSTSALFACDFASSWIGFACALSIAHPLDTLRVRWQTRGIPPMQSLRSDGVRPLYAGVLTPFFANGPIVGCVFASNEFFRATGRWCNINIWGRQHLATERNFTIDELALSGALAGISTSILTCPAAIVRIQQQVASIGGAATPSAANVARRLWLAEGGRGLFRALPYEAAASGVGRMVYFTSYDIMKMQVATSCPNLHPTVAQITAASTTAIVGWVSCFPIDLIKNKLQADAIAARGSPERTYRGFAHCCSETYRIGGARAFWTGFTLTVARSMLSSGISLPVFDAMKPRLRSAIPRCDGTA